MNVLRMMLVIIAAVISGGAIAMATPTKLDDDVITAIAVAVALIMMWIASRTEKQAMLHEEQARELEEQKRVLVRTVDWFSNGTTRPFRRIR